MRLSESSNQQQMMAKASNQEWTEKVKINKINTTNLEETSIDTSLSSDSDTLAKALERSERKVQVQTSVIEALREQVLMMNRKVEKKAEKDEKDEKELLDMMSKEKEILEMMSKEKENALKPVYHAGNLLLGELNGTLTQVQQAEVAFKAVLQNPAALLYNFLFQGGGKILMIDII